MNYENYKNLVYGRADDPGWQTPEYPTRFVYQPNINIGNFAAVASADIADANLQNSPLTCLPGLGCRYPGGCPGQTTCESGRCLAQTITKPVAPAFNNGDILAYTENYVPNVRGCGKAAEGKLSEISTQNIDNKYNINLPGVSNRYKKR